MQSISWPLSLPHCRLALSLQLGVRRQSMQQENMSLLCPRTMYVFVKLDFSNAFNSLHRDVMLQSAYTVIPEIYRFVHQSYSSASVLKFGSFSISSQLGPQQGDPLGPL